MACTVKCKCGKSEKFFQNLNPEDIDCFECPDCPIESEKKEEPKQEQPKQESPAPKKPKAKKVEKEEKPQ